MNQESGVHCSRIACTGLYRADLILGVGFIYTEITNRQFESERERESEEEGEIAPEEEFNKGKEERED